MRLFAWYLNVASLLHCSSRGCATRPHVCQNTPQSVLCFPILVGLMVLVASYSDPRSSPQRRFFSLGVGVGARHTTHTHVRCAQVGALCSRRMRHWRPWRHERASGRGGLFFSFRWELGRYDRTVLTPGLSFSSGCAFTTHTHSPRSTPPWGGWSSVF